MTIPSGKKARILGTDQTILDLSAFPGACDCHVHVFGNPREFPHHPDRVFTPGEALASDLQRHMAALGTARAVIVQPSVYGTDNSCTLDAMRQLGPIARGVCVIDSDIAEAELTRLDKAGVRGVRINLRTAGEHDERLSNRKIAEAADRVAHLGWHVQVYCDRTMLGALARLVPSLPAVLVLDHFADVRAHDGGDMRHLSSLMETGRAYVKLSAPHRVSDGPNHVEAAAIAQDLARTHADRLLWGSDWPHPGVPHGQKRIRDAIEPFQDVDDGMALVRLADWLGDDDILRRILVSNPEELYGFTRKS